MQELSCKEVLPTYHALASHLAGTHLTPTGLLMEGLVMRRRRGVAVLCDGGH